MTLLCEGHGFFRGQSRSASRGTWFRFLSNDPRSGEPKSQRQAGDGNCARGFDHWPVDVAVQKMAFRRRGSKQKNEAGVVGACLIVRRPGLVVELQRKLNVSRRL